MASFLSDLFGGGAEKEAADKNRAAAALYQSQALPALQTGYDTGTGALNKAIGAYDPLATLGAKYSGAGDLLMGALGGGGPAGTAAAQAAFTNSPGYQQGIDAGLTGINRARALSGQLSTGGTDLGALTFAQNNQNQQYNSWLSNLKDMANSGLTATSGAAGGQAGGYTNLANLASQYGQNQANVYGNVEGTNVAANNQQAAGEAAGAKNLLNFGMAAASAAMGIPMPGMSGGGGGGTGTAYNFSNSPLGQGINWLGTNTVGQTMGPSSAGQMFSPYQGPVYTG